jgi:nicotinate-nucleotide--dimethylbenzimidazole phosphoribosyltransferase
VTDFFDVVHSQRACRAFAATPVGDEVLARLLDAATYAPSAENRQPWVFVVVRDAALRARLHDLTERAWEGGGRDFAEHRLTPELLADVERGIAGGGYRAAPVVVVAAADTERCHPATVPSSIFPAVQNLCLAAQASGLGSALTTLTTTFAAELGALLGLPDTVVPQAVVPVGHLARPLGPPRREPFAAHTHRDRFGAPW